MLPELEVTIGCLSRIIHPLAHWLRGWHIQNMVSYYVRKAYVNNRESSESGRPRLKLIIVVGKISSLRRTFYTKKTGYSSSLCIFLRQSYNNQVILVTKACRIQHFWTRAIPSGTSVSDSRSRIIIPFFLSVEKNLHLFFPVNKLPQRTFFLLFSWFSRGH